MNSKSPLIHLASIFLTDHWKDFFLSVDDSRIAIDYETGRHFGTAQPGSLGYLRLRHGRRDLISSAACSSRTIFVHSRRHRNVRVCNRLRNGRRRVLLHRLPDFCARARLLFSPQAIVLRNELFAAMRYTESLPNRCRKIRGSTHLEVDRKDLYFGRVSSAKCGWAVFVSFRLRVIKRAEHVETIKLETNGSIYWENL